jgi:HD-like signal output (HDOD) protein
VPERPLPVDLPPSPPLVARIVNAKDLNDMGRAISEHPKLAKEVLSTINAPFFALVREIKSVEEAVRFLGMSRVINFTLSRLLFELVFQEEDELTTEVWRTSNKIAIGSVILAKTFKAPTDEAFTLGLFHNAGMAIMDSFFEDYAQVVQESYHTPEGKLDELETQKYGTSHAEVGAQLAKKWGLEKSLCLAIEYHHKHDEMIDFIHNSKKKDAVELLVILKMAEKMANLPGYLAKCHSNFEWEHIENHLALHLNISEAKLNKKISDLKVKVSEYKNPL